MLDRLRTTRGWRHQLLAEIRNAPHDPQFTDYALFNELAFTENWYFDPKTGRLYKEVLAVSFVIAPLNGKPNTVVTIALR